MYNQTINLTDMKRIGMMLLLVALALGAWAQKADPRMMDVVNQGLTRARQQALLMAKTLESKDGQLPRTTKDGKLVTSDYSWWCCGFFPGELWYLYENTPDSELRRYAELYTKRCEPVQFLTNSHDVGFMLYCSYGNGLRLTDNKAYERVLLRGARSLSTRYNPHIGLIRSWDWNTAQWQYPVIIDNMMNLELLMWASKDSGEKRFRDIAISHADKTMKNHFRKDYSCYHVVSYDTLTAKPHCKQTHQGYADESDWARGQAWALYGYTMMYRETQLKRYLKQAKHVAKFLMTHPNMPADKIPYWDLKAPDIPNAKRDASAGAVMASALIELGQQVGGTFGQQCIDFASEQLRTLTSPGYLAPVGTNGDFALMHSVGSLPGNSEVDVPLSYADYYYVEALTRMKRLLNE